MLKIDKGDYLIIQTTFYKIGIVWEGKLYIGLHNSSIISNKFNISKDSGGTALSSRAIRVRTKNIGISFSTLHNDMFVHISPDII